MNSKARAKEETKSRPRIDITEGNAPNIRQEVKMMRLDNVAMERIRHYGFKWYHLNDGRKRRRDKAIYN